MTTAAPEFNALDDELFGEFAEQCSIVRGTDAPVITRCLVDDGAQTLGQHGRIIGNKRVLTFIKSEWSPARADQITVRGAMRKVDEILIDDGYTVQAVMHG
ncbi:hypothetical protein PY254_10595 [Rhodanobacter sp. AS-Z3]|uniref:head-tail joining protein n=1 Tax=Rhodanobacter sp. AS-Z3 TaxID=3031330 RepID=UPI00247946A0|nr:hypothetical protein [Rhodanobacter sp. AS-Z3]WEN13695.1 hypothetical protein PY254_10595 [Rhodanobacter sp. AS-Z3]